MTRVEKAHRRLEGFRRQAREDPVGWAEEWLGFKAWRGKGDDQADMIIAGVKDKRAIAATAHAVGKTSSLVIADLALFLGHTYTDGGVRILNTAPTWSQIENIYWAELHFWADRLNARLQGLLYELWGEPKRTFWRFKFNESCYMRGVSPECSDAFQGYHEGLVKVSIDEGVGVRKEIYRGLWGLLSGGDARCMIATNPTERRGGAWEAWGNEGWHQLTISAFEHPNVREGRLIYPKMVTAQWVKEMQERCALEIQGGDYEAHPEYQSRVLGWWPAEGAAGVLIPYELIDEARNRELIPDGELRAGVDVARFGDDSTAVWITQGPGNLGAWKWQGWRTEQVVAVVDEELRRYGFKETQHRVVVDVGFNQGVADGLRMLGYEVLEFRFNGKPRDDTYMSVFDEAAFGLRSRFLAGEVSFAPDFPRPLVSEFANECQRLYSLTAGGHGKKKVEPKDAYKKRVGRGSPDLFDACIMAWYEGVQMADPLLADI